MKNRVGTLYGKPVVIGDKNLVTDNEIHVSNLSNSKTDEDNDKIEYFKFKEPHSRIEDSVFIQIIATVAFENGDNKGIVPLSIFGGGFVYHSILGFCSVGFAINSNGEYMEIHSVAEFLSLVYPGKDDVYNEVGIQPITREEYYNLIK